MKRWLCVIGLVLSLGCTTAIVRPYVGEQQAWPTGSGSIVSTKYALPIFTSLPPSPYEVLAEMRIGSPFFVQPEEGHMPVIVKSAKEIGADALVFVQGKIFFSTNYGPRSGADQTPGVQSTPALTTVNTFNPDSFAPEVTILAIRWTGEPPPGLPTHKKATPAQIKPAEAATESSPQPSPSVAPENKQEQIPAEAPAPAPVVTQPANPSGQ